MASISLPIAQVTDLTTVSFVTGTFFWLDSLDESGHLFRDSLKRGKYIRVFHKVKLSFEQIGAAGT